MTVMQMGCADLHIHTTASDGVGTVQQVLERVARRGNLDVIAITDHDRLDASLWAYEHRENYPFDIIPGVEVSSRGGHILALWVTQPIPANLSIAETTAAIHDQNGLAVLAHPFHIHMGLVARHALGYWRQPQQFLDWGLDALEVHNAGVLTPGSNRVARRVGKRLDMAMLGNSDAHTVGAIGSGRTLFPGRTAADLRAAILNKQTVAKGGVWGLREYAVFIRDLIERRGKRWSDAELEFESDTTPVARV